MNRSFVIKSFLAFILMGGLAVAAQLKQYEGEVVAVDQKAQTFTVKALDASEKPMEMKFHVDKDSEIYVDGDRKILAEVVKGDRVKIGYGTSGEMHTAKRVDRHAAKMSNPSEKVFSGEVIEVDPKAETFTVKAMVAGKVQEMKFHANHETRFYVGGEQLSLVSQLQKGDYLDVHYDTEDNVHHVKQVAKSMKKTS